MNTYALKKNVRKTVLLSIVVISFILYNSFYLLFNSIIENIYRQCPLIKSFICQIEYLGVFVPTLTVITIFELISSIFNNFLWKQKLFLKILKIPNLNGVWEGELESAHTDSNSGQQIKLKMELKITQTWEKMACQCIFPKSESFSDIACLDTESTQGIVLKFTYTNKSHDLQCSLPEFAGYNELTLQNENILSGTYFTKRIPSTRGTILLIRRIHNGNIPENNDI